MSAGIGAMDTWCLQCPIEILDFIALKLTEEFRFQFDCPVAESFGFILTVQWLRVSVSLLLSSGWLIEVSVKCGHEVVVGVWICSVVNVYCWTWLVSGVGHRLSQHLHGELAGLLVLNNHTEADHVIQCINSCEQKLDFHAINEMETGMVSCATNWLPYWYRDATFLSALRVMFECQHQHSALKIQRSGSLWWFSGSSLGDHQLTQVSKENRPLNWLHARIGLLAVKTTGVRH